MSVEITCDGSCAYRPTSPEDYKKYLLKILETYSIEELAQRIDKPVAWIQEKIK